MSSEDCEPGSQMYLRYFRRRRRPLIFILSLSCLVLYWTNFHLSESLSERVEDCEGKCLDADCFTCHKVVREEKIPDINIFEKLKLKRAFRVRNHQANDAETDGGQVCKRPTLDLKHDSMKYAFNKLEHLNCTGTSLFKVKDGIFRLDNGVLRDRELEKCTYYGIERVSDDFATYSEPYAKDKKPWDLLIKEDFVRIKCLLKKDEKVEDKTENNKNIVDDKANKVNVSNETIIDYDSTDQPSNGYYDYYRNFEEHADFDQFIVQVYPKSDVHNRINKIMTKLSAMKYEMTPLNVLMIGLDSMSHMSYQRKLPRTYKFLRDKLGAVILNSYNIVGDATTAALLPILTGKPETELPEARKKWLESVYVNDFPLIWNDFRNQGYVTMFAEDEPSIGVFNLRLNGFDAPPTDHYMRPFWQALWDSELRTSSPKFCTGDTPNHMFLLNYTRSFFDVYRNVSKFAFMFGSELTHWNNNPGEYMDTDLVDLIQYLQTQGHLKNTLLIVFADHGARYSAVRKTVQGKLEERLPMMSFSFPDWFKNKYPHLHKNLRENFDRLTTPFDIHETIKHVLHLSRSQTDFDNSNNVTKGDIPRGISLLHPVPPDRTCAKADIQMHWCTCLKQEEIHSSDQHVQKSVAALLAVINKETEFVKDQCARLTLKRVHSAYLLIPNEQVLMFQKTKDEDDRIANFSANVKVDHAHFQVTLETFPNHGVFEATIQVNMTAGSYLVMDGISRLDMYGNQPACIQDRYPDLRKFCYCSKRGEA